MEKIFDAKLDLNIEPPSHETHFDTLPSTSMCQNGLKFLPFLAYENPYLNVNYLKALMTSPVKFSALLGRNTLCYSVGKFRPAALPLRRQRPLNMRQSAKIDIFTI